MRRQYRHIKRRKNWTAPTKTVTVSPLDLLLPYQTRWVEDPARFKIGVQARQTGKSFQTACEAICGAFTDPGSKWVCLSSGERQALEKFHVNLQIFQGHLAIVQEIKRSPFKFIHGGAIEDGGFFLDVVVNPVGFFQGAIAALLQKAIHIFPIEIPQCNIRSMDAELILDAPYLFVEGNTARHPFA
jgi:hypothetical protein